MADLFGYVAPPIAPGLVEIACELRKETLDAIAVVNGTLNLELGDGRETWIWLAISQLVDFRREARGIVVVKIREELAREKGLI